MKNKYLEHLKDDGKVFMCDCHSPDECIIIHHDKSTYGPDMAVMNDVTIQFHTYLHDNVFMRNSFISFFKRLWWRIKKSYEILVTGYVECDGYWIPARRYGEKMTGVYEMRRFGQHLIDISNEIENDTNNCFPGWTEEKKREFEKELINDWGPLNNTQEKIKE